MQALIPRWVLGAILSAALAACGGGEGADTSARSAVVTATAQASQQAVRQAQASESAAVAAAVAAVPAGSETSLGALRRVKALALSTGGNVSPEEAARQLMDYAEQQYPDYFRGPATAGVMAPFVYRYYPASGTYLGVVSSGGTSYINGGVYVMGGVFGNGPSYVGQLSELFTPLGPAFSTTLASSKAVVTQGSTTTLRVSLARLRGFEGSVLVTLDGLPAGVSAAAVSIGPNATVADITISAQSTAPHSLPTAATVRFSSGNLMAQEPLTVTVRGVPGVIDTSFAGGAVVTPVNTSEDYAHAVAVQPDGKVIVAGTTAISTGTVVALVRYQRDGAIDPSFGIGGKVTLQVGARGDSARALAVQPDGKILVAGWTDQTGIDSNFLVLRLRSDGTPDPTFADAGKFVLAIGTGTDRAHAIAIQDDGKIVVGGESQSGTSNTGRDFALIRLQSNGTLDQGFGNGGKVVTSMALQGGSDTIYALALPKINGEHRILAVGGEGDFIAARYTAGGTLDGSFGNGGKVVGLFNVNIGQARAVTLLPDGRMLLAGGALNDFAAAQLKEDGTPDASFGNGGKVVIPISKTNWDNATAVLRQADGKLLLAGWSYTGNSSAGDFVALRLTAGGTLDESFATGGIAIHPVAQGTKSDSVRGMVLQADDRVPTVRAILAGEVSGSNYDFGLLRLWL